MNPTKKEPKTLYEIRITIDKRGNTEIGAPHAVKSYYDDVPDEAIYNTDCGVIRVLYFETHAQAKRAQWRYLSPLMHGKAVLARKY